MIAELATEEGMPGEMAATAADLVEAMNQPQPVCRFLIADWDGRTAGFCASYLGFSTFLGRATMFVEDVFVRPEHRSRGIGSALLADICRLALDRNLGRVEWRVQTINQPAIDHFHRAGIAANADWKFCRLGLADIERLACCGEPLARRLRAPPPA
jgi:GNAT superfamily N-acetyltransferase